MGPKKSKGKSSGAAAPTTSTSSSDEPTMMDYVGTSIPVLNYFESGNFDHFEAYRKVLAGIVAFQFKELVHIINHRTYLPHLEPDVPSAQQLKENIFAKDVYMEKVRAHMKEEARMKGDKRSLFALIHATLSETSLDKVKSLSNFDELEKNGDPLELWNVIYKIHTVPDSGCAELDAQALRDAYSALRQGPQETVAHFRKCTDNAIAALRAAKATVPSDKDQASDFIAHLDSTRFHKLRLQLRNTRVYKHMKFPVNLIEAVELATHFHDDEPDQVADPGGPAVSVFVAQSNNQAAPGGKPGKRKKGKKSNESGEKAEVKKEEIKKPKPERVCPPDRLCPICLQKTGHWPSKCPVLESAHKQGLFKDIVKSKSGHAKAAVMDEDDDGDESDFDVYAVYHDDSLVVRTSGLPTEMPQKVRFVAAASGNKRLSATDLLLDNQAEMSIVHNRELVTNIRPASMPIRVKGVGGTLVVTEIADLIAFDMPVYFHPDATANIVSFSAAVRRKEQVGFDANSNTFVWVRDGQRYVFSQKRGLYVLDCSKLCRAATVAVTTVAENEAKYTARQVSAAKAARRLTQKLGYPSDKDLINMIQGGSILNCPVTAQDIFRAIDIYGPDLASLKGKTTWRKPIALKLEHTPRAVLAEQALHADVMFVEGEPYLISVSDPLDMVMVRRLKSRHHSELLKGLTEQLAKYKAAGFDIRLVITDGENGFGACADGLLALGANYEQRAPGSHDGVVERRIRVLKERVRAHLSVLPYRLRITLLRWLVMFCASRLNILPNGKRADPVSPREAFLGRKLDFKRDLIEFGAYAQTHVESGTTNSMAERTQGVIVLLPQGNLEGSVKCYCLSTKRIVTRARLTILPIPEVVIEEMNRLAALDKKQIPDDPSFQVNGSEVSDDECDDSVVVPQAPLRTIPADQVVAEPTAPGDVVPHHRGATEVDTPSDDRGDISPVPLPDAVASDTTVVPTRASPPSEPPPVPTIVRRSDENSQGMRLRPKPPPKVMFSYNITSAKALRLYKNKALRSIVAEVLQMDNKAVVEPVFLHSLSRAQMKAIIRSSLFLKEKHLPSGEFDKLKARLVAGGHMQDRTVYTEQDTSSPTIATSSALMLAALAAKEGRCVATVDIAGAYLNAPMKEREVLMRIEPLIAGILAKFRPRFRDYINPDGSMVVRLLKALYGCVESAKLWYEHLTATMKKLGFTPNAVDRCVFNRNVGDHQCSAGVHVDDLIITATDPAMLEELIRGLESEYKTITVHRGKEHGYLGMNFDFREDGAVRVTMPGYIREVLDLYSVSGREKSPATDKLFVVLEESLTLNAARKEEFHSRVAKLLYLAKRVRPDILTAIAFLATRVSIACDDDWDKLERVLRYLNATAEIGIELRPSKDIAVKVYADASFGVHADAKGHTGVVITLGAGPIFIKSTKQKLVSKSSTEAELIALSDCVSQAVHVREFLIHQGYDVPPAEIFQDNKSTIALADRGYSASERTKHIHIRYFFVKDRADRREVKITYLPTADMIADFLTKPLRGALFRELRSRLLNWND